jgi:hypothetical protein
MMSKTGQRRGIVSCVTIPFVSFPIIPGHNNHYFVIAITMWNGSCGLNSSLEYQEQRRSSDVINIIDDNNNDEDVNNVVNDRFSIHPNSDIKACWAVEQLRTTNH